MSKMAQEKTFPDSKITQYVSNVDRDVYTVSNIPEEVIAVIFAYVSRSPKSFRDNIGVVIEEEQLGQERASKFHEKWVLNYGHASVAEHATVHIGIERVSRLFSSVLELSNEFLSFTEYSQRYQKPVKGDFYIPGELYTKKSLLNEYIELNNYQYDVYSKLNDILFSYLKNTFPVPDGKEEKPHYRALEKIAFEDARYALGLATYTNLGMTANARAIEDCLTKLLSSKYPEVRKRAAEIKEEVRFSVPTLVKYADENEYLKNVSEEFGKFTLEGISDDLNNLSGRNVELIHWTGMGCPDPEDFALRMMVKAILFEHSHRSYKEISDFVDNLSFDEVLSNLQKAIDCINKYDNPVNAFKYIKYEAEFIISEACWHQLLRHRKIDWVYQEPSIYSGVTIPPNINSADAGHLLCDVIERSELLYENLKNEGMKEVAEYVVTNAHNRRVIGSFDLWELYHLINLRMSEGAQWDIKNVTNQLSEIIKGWHPRLVEPALKRVTI